VGIFWWSGEEAFDFFGYPEEERLQGHEFALLGVRLSLSVGTGSVEELGPTRLACLE
jgi:hypothetical protein